MTSEERDSAVQSLNEALVEQDRLSECYDAAIGTATELGAYVRLRAAGDRVAARGAWLSWIDDEGYRGLNAGPFELLAESDRRLGRVIEAGTTRRAAELGVLGARRSRGQRTIGGAGWRAMRLVTGAERE
jgi:hypothetical protein